PEFVEFLGRDALTGHDASCLGVNAKPDRGLVPHGLRNPTSQDKAVHDLLPTESSKDRCRQPRIAVSLGVETTTHRVAFTFLAARRVTAWTNLRPPAGRS